MSDAMSDDGVQQGAADRGQESGTLQALHQRPPPDRADAVVSKLLDLQRDGKRALVVMVSHQSFMERDLSVKILRSAVPLQGIYDNGDGTLYALGVDRTHDPPKGPRLRGLFAKFLSPRNLP